MFSNTIDVLKSTMDVCVLRQNVHAQNIANAETPGYKRKYVAFEELLKSEMRLSLVRTHEKHMSSSQRSFGPKIFTEKDVYYRNDETGVDIDFEIAQMTMNGLKYEILSRLVSKNFEYYNIVLRGV
ncbi:flagellar basal body rod protein FlgB [Pseudothermotoga thermarum]|uniref:Flagellar basal body rod protein FlgB n=1 Tax=Pseudothermotoga thermarum DSM 5069 TaxID=688269 RepID=F7YY49_9THEM|nr:flagellar basal body rod protein FlgB [Pseudothermotoga thermarum]AEH50862.1 flagellar basal-body rod protein FlgB [Pseudothermotoga thermarum DSM 5069]